MKRYKCLKLTIFFRCIFCWLLHAVLLKNLSTARDHSSKECNTIVDVFIDSCLACFVYFVLFIRVNLENVFIARIKKHWFAGNSKWDPKIGSLLDLSFLPELNLIAMFFSSGQCRFSNCDESSNASEANKRRSNVLSRHESAVATESHRVSSAGRLAHDSYYVRVNTRVAAGRPLVIS